MSILPTEEFDKLATEHAAKQARVVEILESHQADAVLLTSTAALTWYLGGSRVHISLAGAPIAAALVHRGGAEVGLFVNESARLQAEELGGTDGVTVHELPWHGNLADLASWYPQANDWVVLAEDAVGDELRAARASLLPVEVERYRSLCRDAAAALTDVLTEVTEETTEMELASELGRRIIEFGADPVVLLVSGASRAEHRHPLPTDAPIGRRAMAVVCARRHGLIANVTRWVTFGEPLDGEEDLDARILEVEADIFAQLAPGATMDAVLPAIQASYPAHGFADDEWTLHHQGGAAGYNGRDPRLEPGVTDPIVDQQAFAWNPSGADPATGLVAKVEDTVLLTAVDGETTLEVLSVDPRWPSVEVAGVKRPAVLRR
ncbi:M24 family metallopeptidase [Zhihengliuella salsuginis]|uniref:Peptidase M24 n=1 Tax=Zhihengliuella salsuginis TaxID=578222 RepID=A0ABQ3GHI2_9MICC|nr:M24 family metallopeptidase [Zhihengliuella salsuginis]GHD06883.1 peptidase M24 [Zhihengliuella salsuginis]